MRQPIGFEAVAQDLRHARRVADARHVRPELPNRLPMRLDRPVDVRLVETRPP